LAASRDEPLEQEDADRIVVDMAIVESAAAAYLSRYYFDEAPELTEVEYLVRLRSPYTGAYSNTFDLHGRADGVTDHGAFLELTEDKLVGQIDAVSVKKTRGDRQLSLGAYALWRITGKPVRKVRKRFTKKPQIRQRKGESVAEFCERIRADYRERPDFYMHEETTFRDADDMLDVERSLWDWAEQRRAAQRRGFWPMNTDRCHDYGGCDYPRHLLRRTPRASIEPKVSTSASRSASRQRRTTPMANSRPPLTEFQKRVYEEIHHSSGRTAATIAQRAGLPSGKHVGRALDRIREKGYIVGDEQASRGGRGGKWVRVRG
jgi:hypothetical protein